MENLKQVNAADLKKGDSIINLGEVSHVQLSKKIVVVYLRNIKSASQHIIEYLANQQVTLNN